MPDRTQAAVASVPPSGDILTAYDRAHLVTYLKLLDAETMQIDWMVTARSVLSLDPEADVDAAQRVYAAHLARAHWMTHVGFRHLLK
jgi:hypothetical protein